MNGIRLCGMFPTPIPIKGISGVYVDDVLPLLLLDDEDELLDIPRGCVDVANLTVNDPFFFLFLSFSSW